MPGFNIKRRAVHTRMRRRRQALLLVALRLVSATCSGDASASAHSDGAGELRASVAGGAAVARSSAHLKVMTFYGGTADELHGWSNVLRSDVSCPAARILESLIGWSPPIQPSIRFNNTLTKGK